MMKALSFITYPVTDVPRAVEFYRDVIGLLPSDETFNENYVEFDTGSAAFAVDGEPADISPGSQRCAAFEVEDVAAERERLIGKGVPVSELWAFPICKICFVTDPDGNRFTLHQRTL